MINFGGKKVDKMLIGNSVIYQDSDGWFPLKMGTNVGGFLLGKIDEANSQLLVVGAASTKLDGYQIIVCANSVFKFNFSSQIGAGGLYGDTNGAPSNIDLKTDNSGNMAGHNSSYFSGKIGWSLTFRNGKYRNDGDMTPAKFPIVLL
ncbi:hypothetical protein [Levilactobacillus brevis]|uniref:hypothetical protein n=1 Tax=Levilactobacillus brevis TaxID=1580 RepID=UPI000BE83AB3|nr:hypothetical protein [Levilactobacillus brevis]